MLPLQFESTILGLSLTWFIVLLWCIIGIVLAIWVYRDAQSRNDKNAVIWLILTIFLSIIGLLIYIIVRK